jgi:hypothetical protein
MAALGQALTRDSEPSGRWWTLAFSLAALVCLTRSAFHLAWMLGLVGLAVAAVPSRWRMVLTRAALPTSAVVAWYAKNLVLVGIFGASSWLGLSLAKTTVGQLPPETRAEWVAEGTLSSVAEVDPFAGPRAYRSHVDVPPPAGVPALDRWSRASGAPNYNHRVFPVVSRARQANAWAVVRRRPALYLRTAARDVGHWLSPATTWHPREPEGSPFQPNRAALGGMLGAYEDAYNAVVHVPLAGVPVGIYAAVPLLLLAALGWGVWRLGTGTDPDRRRAAFVLALAGTCAYLLLVCCLLETGVELSRMRFMVDALLLVLAAVFVQRVARSEIRAARVSSSEFREGRPL